MLEIVVICLLTQFCLRLWAQLRRKFELWDKEIEEISNYDENELEKTEAKDIKDQQDTKCQQEKKKKTIRELSNENNNNDLNENELYLASNTKGLYEKDPLRKKSKRDIEAQDLRKQIRNLAHEINEVRSMATTYYKGYIWASNKGLSRRHALFSKYEATREKMTNLKKQLAELQGRMEGKLCTDESCIVNKEIFKGKDIQEYNETSCRKWHIKRKTGQEMGTRPRNSRLKLCKKDYSCVNRLCTAWHQKDAKFCTTSWAPCVTWHGGKCELKLPKEQPINPFGREKMEKVICENDVDNCMDPECTRFHYVGIWISTSEKGWIERNTGKNAVPLMAMKLLCSDGRRTTRTPCRKHDCLYRHQYPHIRDQVPFESNKKLNGTENQTKENTLENNPLLFCSRTCAMEYETTGNSGSSRTSSSTNYTPKVKKARRDEELKGEARRIERPRVARLPAELTREDAITTTVIYDLLRKAKKDQEDYTRFLDKASACKSCKEKGKSTADCAKTEHWTKRNEKFLEKGTTYLTNVCRKMATDQKTKDTKMKPEVNHPRLLLTDGCELGNSSGYQTPRQKKRSKIARKKARRALKAQKAQEEKRAENIRIRQEKEKEFEDKINAEKNRIAAIQNTLNPTEEKLRSSAPSIEEAKDYFEYLSKLKRQDSKAHTQNNFDTPKYDETEDGIVAIQNTAKPEKPKVEPTSNSNDIEGTYACSSNDIGEMFTRASMEHIDRLRRFEERAKEAKAAAELREATKLEEAKRYKIMDNVDKLKEDELQEDLDRLEILRTTRHRLEEKRAELMKEIKRNLGFNISTEKNDEKETEEKKPETDLEEYCDE